MHCSTSAQQNLRISYFRAFACIGIVLLHATFTSRMLYADRITENQALISDIICNLLMWCVPGFIMVTGILLLNPEREVSMAKAVKKYVWRVLKALILFQFAYKLIDTLLAGQRIETQTITEILNNILTAGGTSLLWYLYMLIGLYLLMPFSRR